MIHTRYSFLMQMTYWNINLADNAVTIMKCSDVGVDYLQVQYSVSMFIMFHSKKCQDLGPCLESCFRDYQKDNFIKNLGYQSYTEYMEYVIDVIMNQQEHTASIIDHRVHTVFKDACPGVDHCPFVIPKHLSELCDAIIADFNNMK